jgi:uncharacterized protein
MRKMKYNPISQAEKRSMMVSGEQRINAPREVLWAALHDPDILRRCVPGCTSVARISDTEMHAVTTVNVEPIAGSFNSRLTLSAIDPPEACRIDGESQGGAAGHATWGAELSLEVVGGASTLLNYQVDATVGGALADLDGSMIDRFAHKMARDFCARLNDALTSSATEPGPATNPIPATESGPKAESAPAAGPAAREAFSPAFWLAITVVLITLVLYMMALM